MTLKQIELSATDPDTKLAFTVLRAEQAAAQRRWREKNPDKYRESNRLAGKRHREKVKLFCDVHISRTGGCQECGRTAPYPECFRFVYTNNSGTFYPSACGSLAKAEREMAKCVVLCLNCHAVRASKRVRPNLNTREQ